jgi:hypothetical protein
LFILRLVPCSREIRVREENIGGHRNFARTAETQMPALSKSSGRNEVMNSSMPGQDRTGPASSGVSSVSQSEVKWTHPSDLLGLRNCGLADVCAFLSLLVDGRRVSLGESRLMGASNACAKSIGSSAGERITLYDSEHDAWTNVDRCVPSATSRNELTIRLVIGKCCCTASRVETMDLSHFLSSLSSSAGVER